MCICCRNPLGISACDELLILACYQLFICACYQLCMCDCYQLCMCDCVMPTSLCLCFFLCQGLHAPALGHGGTAHCTAHYFAHCTAHLSTFHTEMHISLHCTLHCKFFNTAKWSAHLSTMHTELHISPHSTLETCIRTAHCAAHCSAILEYTCNCILHTPIYTLYRGSTRCHVQFSCVQLQCAVVYSWHCAMYTAVDGVQF